MSKVTILPCESPRCITCGRDLPKERKQKCYICRPSKSKYYIPEKLPDPTRKIPSIEVCCALAWAYGISYGRVVQIIENDLPWSPKKRPVVLADGTVILDK